MAYFNPEFLTMHDDTSAEEIIRSILPFSRYAQRLLESEPELSVELRRNLRHPWSAAEMEGLLRADSDLPNNEAGMQVAFADCAKT